jgi:hypothetical protein
MKKFEFQEKGHKYFLDGKAMTGCTTVLGMIAKPALIGWSAKMASEYVRENLKDLKDLNEVCDKAKTAHRIRKEEAGQKGTDVHAIIEDFIKGAIQINDGIISADMKSEEKQVQNFLVWAMNNNITFLESEKKVYSEKYFVAGTYDFKCEIDGKIYLGDIKTSSGIYDRTPLAQCAAYQMMELEHEPDNKIDGRLVINIKKTGVFDEDKDVYVSEHYEDDLSIFMSALELYRQLKNKFEPLNYQFNKNK